LFFSTKQKYFQSILICLFPCYSLMSNWKSLNWPKNLLFILNGKLRRRLYKSPTWHSYENSPVFTRFTPYHMWWLYRLETVVWN
jgi:surface polysaccharide O-acyltransferase-like enzyme